MGKKSIRDEVFIPDQWAKGEVVVYGSSHPIRDKVSISRPMGKRRGCSLRFLPSNQRQGFHSRSMDKKNELCLRFHPSNQRRGFHFWPIGKKKSMWSTTIRGFFRHFVTEFWEEIGWKSQNSVQCQQMNKE
jgi:hypothetical protein